MSCSESVNKVVEIYIESLKESSAAKVKEALICMIEILFQQMQFLL